MYIAKNDKVLLDLGFKEYRNGYSKKYLNKDYNFIDILYENFILKKVKFVEKEFVYENIEYDDLYLLVKYSLKLNDSELIKKYIEENFRKED